MFYLCIWKFSHFSKTRFDSFAFTVAEAPDGGLMGYVIGKAEGEGPLWHGHVSAVTVSPEYRRLGLAQNLMDLFEDICEKTHNAFFVDLFVRESNKLAIGMYEKFGYTIYRTVLDYYSGVGTGIGLLPAINCNMSVDATSKHDATLISQLFGLLFSRNHLKMLLI